MALATTNFEVGLVQLAIQNGSVFSSQRPVAPTYSMLLGKDAEMQDNIISGVKGVPTYGALSDAEIRSGIIRSFLGYQTTLGGSVTRANQTATISTFTPQEVQAKMTASLTKNLPNQDDLSSKEFDKRVKIDELVEPALTVFPEPFRIADLIAFVIFS